MTCLLAHSFPTPSRETNIIRVESYYIDNEVCSQSAFSLLLIASLIWREKRPKDDVDREQ